MKAPTTKTIKKIKENITIKEYKILMAAAKGSDTMRANTINNLLRAFTILFYTGLRLNELQELRITHIKELLSTGQTKINLPKTTSERKLFATDDFKKQLGKLFDLNIEDDENRIITKGSNKSKRTGINTTVFIQQINRFIQQILGTGYSSHSFRQSLITEMASKSINVKIISQFIGHSDVKTTMRYIKATDEDIMNSLIR